MRDRCVALVVFCVIVVFPAPRTWAGIVVTAANRMIDYSGTEVPTLGPPPVINLGDMKSKAGSGAFNDNLSVGKLTGIYPGFAASETIASDVNGTFIYVGGEIQARAFANADADNGRQIEEASGSSEVRFRVTFDLPAAEKFLFQVSGVQGVGTNVSGGAIFYQDSTVLGTFPVDQANNYSKILVLPKDSYVLDVTFSVFVDASLVGSNNLIAVDSAFAELFVSLTPVPEPSSLLLAGLGSLILVVRGGWSLRR